MTARTEAARSGDRDRVGPRPRLGPLTQYALLAGPPLSMLDSSIVNVAVVPRGVRGMGPRSRGFRG